MSTLVIEHYKVAELPPQWAQRLNAMPGQTVTVRIETETSTDPASTDTTFMTDDPAFGIWRDREEMTDVDLYVRALRAPRQS